MDKFLRQFIAVAEAGSLTAAAASLLMSQPTLTTNMKRLEDAIGAPLFLRKARGIQLTKYGETLYHNALLMRRLYDNTLAAIEQQLGEEENALSIGTGYTWWTHLFRDMVVEFARSNPNAPITVSVGNQLRLMDQLLSCDIVFFMGHEIEGLNQATGTSFMVLGEVTHGYYVRRGHPLLGATRTQDEVNRYPWVADVVPEVRYQRFLAPLVSQGPAGMSQKPARRRFACNALAACVDFVERTDAVHSRTEIPGRRIDAGNLARVDVSEPSRRYRVGLYLLEERLNDPRVSSIIDEVKLRAAALFEPDRSRHPAGGTGSRARH